MMLFSIVMPSFNQAAYLPEAVNSVLAQSYRPLELIIVDGASIDGSVELIRELADKHAEIRWLSEPDNGPADAVNKGLKMARGEFIGIQSSDDLYVGQALAEAVELFARHPEYGLLYGEIEAISDSGKLIKRGRNLPDFSWPAWFGISLALPQSSIFFRAELSRQTGFWNGDYYGCDLDYWMRLAFRTTPLHVPRVWSQWRMHETQRTKPEQFRRIVNDYWRMIENSTEVAGAPRRIRRMAYASRHIMSLTWEVDDSLWHRRWHALAALWGHPTCWRYFSVTRFLRLIPGYASLAKLRRWLVPRATAASL